jgi:glycosyltransferase involved in cell wall biosynthesis
MELIVVDNDNAPSARAIVQAAAAKAPFPVIYVHEPRPGVASARNAAMAQVRAPFVAFLDDDEEAPQGWLGALVRAQAAFEADVVFGPVRGAAPQSAGWRRAYLERFFSREGPPFSCVIEQPYGCGCSLVRVAALPATAAPFSLAQNRFGGEDDLLFAQMKARGAHFAWAPDAWVLEHPAPERLTLRYALRRAFAYGQGPAFAGWRRRDWPAVAFWMTVGAVQTPVYGGLAALKWLQGAPDRAFALDRAARAAGKLLWFPPFKPSFYGLSG